LARLAEEQAALRRVATLVAQATPPEQVLAAVAEETGLLLEVDYTVLIRSDPQDMITVVGGWTATGGALPSPAGSRFEVGGRNVSTLTLRTGRPARLDAYVDVTGSIGNTGAQGWGFRSSVGVPISVEGRPWGLILVAYTRDQQLPADTEARLASFTELVATAIANTESRAALARLAQEQTALRRVATLVAHGAAPEQVFAAVTEEYARLVPVDAAAMARLEPDGTVTYVASWGRAVDFIPVGSQRTLDGNNIATAVFETGRPARVESQAGATGSLADLVREIGVRSVVATPVVVEGRLWGEMGAGSTLEQPLPPDAETRLASFTELVATAIANADSRAGGLTRDPPGDPFRAWSGPGAADARPPVRGTGRPRCHDAGAVPRADRDRGVLRRVRGAGQRDEACAGLARGDVARRARREPAAVDPRRRHRRGRSCPRIRPGRPGRPRRGPGRLDPRPQRGRGRDAHRGGSSPRVRAGSGRRLTRTVILLQSVHPGHKRPGSAGLLTLLPAMRLVLLSLL
jgi:GAF domain-containing protein